MRSERSLTTVGGVDREALDHSLVRRLLDHIEHGTTDLADAVLEVPADTYTSPERAASRAAPSASSIQRSSAGSKSSRACMVNQRRFQEAADKNRL